MSTHNVWLFHLLCWLSFFILVFFAVVSDLTMFNVIFEVSLLGETLQNIKPEAERFPKKEQWPESEASSATVKFQGQSFSQGHYPPIY